MTPLLTFLCSDETDSYIYFSAEYNEGKFEYAIKVP